MVEVRLKSIGASVVSAKPSCVSAHQSHSCSTSLIVRFYHAATITAASSPIHPLHGSAFHHCAPKITVPTFPCPSNRAFATPARLIRAGRHSDTILRIKTTQFINYESSLLQLPIWRLRQQEHRRIVCNDGLRDVPRSASMRCCRSSARVHLVKSTRRANEAQAVSSH